jgi:hypothetical protein
MCSERTRIIFTTQVIELVRSQIMSALLVNDHSFSVAEKSGLGMRRFYSARNLERYRRLANGAITAVERQRILSSLAKEVVAFRREARRHRDQNAAK